jgi:hypothetical protein
MWKKNNQQQEQQAIPTLRFNIVCHHWSEVIELMFSAIKSKVKNNVEIALLC